MNCLSRRVDPGRYYGVIGLATDIRLRTPPHPERHGWRTRRCTSTPSSSAGYGLARGLPRRRLHDRAAAGDSPGAGGRSMTDLNAPILNIEGELVALGPLRREHPALSALDQRFRHDADARRIAATDDARAGDRLVRASRGRRRWTRLRSMSERRAARLATVDCTRWTSPTGARWSAS